MVKYQSTRISNKIYESSTFYLLHAFICIKHRKKHREQNSNIFSWSPMIRWLIEDVFYSWLTISIVRRRDRYVKQTIWKWSTMIRRLIRDVFDLWSAISFEFLYNNGVQRSLPAARERRSFVSFKHLSFFLLFNNHSILHFFHLIPLVHKWQFLCYAVYDVYCNGTMTISMLCLSGWAFLA